MSPYFVLPEAKSAFCVLAKKENKGLIKLTVQENINVGKIQHRSTITLTHCSMAPAEQCSVPWWWPWPWANSLNGLCVTMPPFRDAHNHKVRTETSGVVIRIHVFPRLWNAKEIERAPGQEAVANPTLLHLCMLPWRILRLTYSNSCSNSSAKGGRHFQQVRELASSTTMCRAHSVRNP